MDGAVFLMSTWQCSFLIDRKHHSEAANWSWGCAMLPEHSFITSLPELSVNSARWHLCRPYLPGWITVPYTLRTCTSQLTYCFMQPMQYLWLQ